MPGSKKNIESLPTILQPREKRRLLNSVLSNCSREDGEIVATFRQLFDLLAETTVFSAYAEAGGMGNSAKSEIWLGDLDSNQGCSGQSREFYR